MKFPSSFLLIYVLSSFICTRGLYACNTELCVLSFDIDNTKFDLITCLLQLVNHNNYQYWSIMLLPVYHHCWDQDQVTHIHGSIKLYAIEYQSFNTTPLSICHFSSLDIGFSWNLYNTGVIWKGDSLIEGVPETLELLRSKVCTNYVL